MDRGEAMFLLIGGIQPKTVTLDETPQLCPGCGLAQARLKRVDDYVSLFFVPIFPLRKGQPVLMCDHCHAVSSPDAHVTAPSSTWKKKECGHCRFPIESAFDYCPRCGNRV